MEPTARRRCAHIDALYGPCALPARHAGDCLHEDQPRCGNTSPHDGHVCVLERHHEGLHADKPLAEITPDGSRMVWQILADLPSACSDPNSCDEDSGEPCERHEREQAHAEGEHAFCGAECPAP